MVLVRLQYLHSKQIICTERTGDVFLPEPVEVHSLPASSVMESRLSRSAIRPLQRNLIYYLRFCFRLDSVNAIDSCLMNCIRGVDHLNSKKKKIYSVYLVSGIRTL